MDKIEFDKLVSDLKISADSGDVTSMKLLGDALYQGASGKEKNEGAAFPYWYMAAQNGDSSLYSKVGLLLFSGDDGVTQNMEEGLRFLIAAADNGDYFAQYYLGMFYECGVEEDGRTLLNSNAKLAAKYYRMSALQNCTEAQYNLGKLLVNNKLPERDEYLHWFCCAAINGHKEARELVDGFMRRDSESERITGWLIEGIKEHGVTYRLKNCVTSNSSSRSSSVSSGSSSSGNSEGCYIATAVYGSYSAPEVITLRRFRDERLNKSLLGRAFIKTYYTLSPPLAERLKNANHLNAAVKHILDHFVQKLRNS